MSIIGEAALTSLFDGLFKKLGSQMLLKFARQHHVAAEIRKWERMLRPLMVVLEDAKQKQLRNEMIKQWLDDLQHLAYDVEDILDEFNYEIMRHEVKAKNQGSTSLIRNLTPKFISNYTPESLLFNSKMASKLQKITTRLQEITSKKRDLGLSEIVGTGASQKGWSRPLSSSVPNEPVFIGRDEEKRKIIKLLLRHKHGDARVRIIPIVGMGGLGKTSLARSIFNDDEVKQSFEKRVWVCVSQDYDVTRITKEILEEVSSQSCDLKDLNLIQVKLNETLSGKKFLIVIDDLWNKNYGDWNDLRAPLMHGAAGSNIIFTTRLNEVANMMTTVKFEGLRLLLDDECWLIFCSHAFDWNGNSPPNARFEEIGKKIVQKHCSGMPLAARTLGGLLRSKREDDWEAIMNRNSLSSKDGKTDILSVLWMSYYDLPSHLKRCFAYCALFPEDFEFEEDELVWLWMAEGLIHCEDEDVEDLGHNYFRDLVARSMFLPSNSKSNPWRPVETQYVIHDLVHDLAKEVAGKMCYRVDMGPPKNATIEKARYSTFIHERIQEFEHLQKLELLRSVKVLPMFDLKSEFSDVSKKAITDLISKLRYLRVLSLAYLNIFGPQQAYGNSELLRNIGNLKHLRYLNLSHTHIRSLPKSTSSLYNLQTLLLIKCRQLQTLPEEMGNLINLWHLDISYTKISELPLGIKEMKNLRRLSDFIVGKGNGLIVTSLKDMKFLRGALCISKLENITSAEDARSAGLSNKKNLEALSLKWSPQPHDAAIEGDVLEELQPCKDLKELSIWGYGGTSFPSWMKVELSLLREIKIVGCPQLSGSLPLSMPSLKVLNVQKCPGVTVSLCSLPKLSRLRIQHCEKVDCEEEANFASLDMLVLSNITNVSSLVKDKVVEGIKYVKSLVLCDTDLEYLEIAASKTDLPSWVLVNLPQVTSVMMDENNEQVQQALCQSKVKFLVLWEFQSLQKLPQWICNAVSLEYLEVSKCPSLRTLSPTGHFPPKLSTLRIEECAKLKSLSQGGRPFSSISHFNLLLFNCSRLEAIVEKLDGRTYPILDIRGCPRVIVKRILGKGIHMLHCPVQSKSL